MKTFEYTITDPLGMHARRAGELVKEAAKYKSDITIEKDGQSADAKRIFDVLGLDIKCAQTVRLTVKGGDEDRAYDVIFKFMKDNA